MTALLIVGWVLVVGSNVGIIVAGATLALDRTVCGPTPRWVMSTLCGSVIVGSLGAIAAQVTV